MTLNTIRIATWGFVLAAWPYGCESPVRAAPADRPNIVLILATHGKLAPSELPDEHRSRQAPPVVVKTPAIDRFT